MPGDDQCGRARNFSHRTIASLRRFTFAVWLGVRLIQADRIKFLALTVGISIATTLIVLQAAVYEGFVARMSAWLDGRSGVDVWVGDPDIAYADDLKGIKDSMLYRVRGLPGVAWAVPMTRAFLHATLPGGVRVPVRLIGVDDATLIGAPRTIIEGEVAGLRSPDGIILSQRAFDAFLKDQASATGRAAAAPVVGDVIEVNDVHCRVIALCDEPPEFFWDPVIYMSRSAAVKIIPPQRKTTTFILVGTTAGADATAVAHTIRTRMGLSARTGEDFAAVARIFQSRRTGVRANFGTTIGLGAFVSVISCGVLLLLATTQTLPIFGMMLALGLETSHVILVMLAQAGYVGVLGVGLGFGASVAVGSLLALTGLSLSLSAHIFLLAGLGVLLCVIVGSLISVAKLLGVEPSLVFRAA